MRPSIALRTRTKQHTPVSVHQQCSNGLARTGATCDGLPARLRDHARLSRLAGAAAILKALGALLYEDVVCLETDLQLFRTDVEQVLALILGHPSTPKRALKLLQARCGEDGGQSFIPQPSLYTHNLYTV